MKIISVFNNKGGVGKSTLCFHLACTLNEMEKSVLLVDLDPLEIILRTALNKQS